MACISPLQALHIKAKSHDFVQTKIKRKMKVAFLGGHSLPFKLTAWPMRYVNRLKINDTKMEADSGKVMDFKKQRTEFLNCS